MRILILLLLVCSVFTAVVSRPSLAKKLPATTRTPTTTNAPSYMIDRFIPVVDGLKFDLNNVKFLSLTSNYFQFANFNIYDILNKKVIVSISSWNSAAYYRIGNIFLFYYLFILENGVVAKLKTVDNCNGAAKVNFVCGKTPKFVFSSQSSSNNCTFYTFQVNTPDVCNPTRNLRPPVAAQNTCKSIPWNLDRSVVLSNDCYVNNKISVRYNEHCFGMCNYARGYVAAPKQSNQVYFGCAKGIMGSPSFVPGMTCIKSSNSTKLFP